MQDVTWYNKINFATILDIFATHLASSIDSLAA